MGSEASLKTNTNTKKAGSSPAFSFCINMAFSCGRRGTAIAVDEELFYY